MKHKYFGTGRLLLFVICLLICPLSSNAQELKLEDAKSKAISFFNRKSNAKKIKSQKALESQDIECVYSDNQSDIFIFSKNDPISKGFVIIGANEDNLPSVWGFSESQFDSETLPPSFKWWLNQCKTKGQAKVQATNTRESIYPLINTKWGQNSPFNNSIPSLGSNYQPFPTGCTATALSQIMRYWQYPTYGKGSNSYSISYSGVKTLTFSANFQNTRYDWNNMIDDYSYDNYSNLQADAVSTLMYHVGVAENTRYSGGGSSASTQDGAIALINNFDYDKSIKKANRLFYSDEEWCQLIYDELHNGRPVYYSADKDYEGEVQGHAFIIHGYDAENDLFAVNWGWSGYCDGYFSLIGRNPLNPYQSKPSAKSKKAILNQSDISLAEVAYYDDVLYFDNDDECKKTPSLNYDVFDVQGQYKLKGVCCDGASQVKIVLQNGSYLPESKCGYTYEWSLNEPIGKLSNTDNPKEVTYTAPDKFPGKDNESTYTIKARIHYKNSDPTKDGSEEVSIQISRVPLVLVHGLNDTCTTWFPFKDYLVRKGAYRHNLIWCSDYSGSNCSHFKTNRLVVSSSIEIVKRHTLSDGFASKKVDVIGHSMGGILARLHVQYNNGKKDINKLITVNTPHSGSFLGDVFGNQQHPKILSALGFSSEDAINDLALNSDEIDNYLNSSSAINKLNGIPVHAIETEYTGGISGSYGNWATAIIAICFNNGLSFFHGGASDGIVSLTSQKGGCSKFSYFTGLHHLASHKNGLVQSKLFSLLNSPNNSTEFSFSGFHPEDLSWSGWHTSSSAQTRMLSTRSNSQLHVENHGNMIDVNISNPDNYQSCTSIVSFENDSLCLYDSFSFSCPIPETFKGIVNIVSILGNGTGDFSYLTDSLDIQESGLQLSKIESVNPLETIFLDDIIPIKVKCTWSNGEVSETSPDQISDVNNLFAYQNGLLYANSIGRSSIRLDYRGQSCMATLEVNSRGELISVSDEDIYHGNNLDEPGYNIDQEIIYNIRPNEGGDYICQIVSIDGITMISPSGNQTYQEIINRETGSDKQLKFKFTPMNCGLNTAKFYYGIIIQNVINGQMYFQKGGSTDNLSSKELRPGYFLGSPVTTNLNTNILPYNGTYSVVPAFSTDGGNNWNKMNYDISFGTPIIEVTGGENSEKVNLPISISQDEIQVGKTADFFYSDFYNGEIIYTSSNPDIAEVTYDGTIIAKTKGIVTITVNISGDANYLPEDKEYTITVVDHKVSPLLMSVSSNKLKVGETTKVTYAPEYKGHVSYEVNPTGIIRIISDGTIEALSSGIVTFYATSSSDEDYYETINSFTIEVIEDELDMEEELSIKNIPTIGIDNVISEGNSNMIVKVYNNTNDYISNATLYYTINLDGGRKSNWYIKSDLPAATSFTLNHDLFNLKEYMTPGHKYICNFYKDEKRTIPMNLPSATFTYGEVSNLQVELFDSQYKTISLPFDSNVPHGMKAYTIRAYYENTIVLSEVSFLNKHNSYIICGTPQKYTFSGILYPIDQNPQSGFMVGLQVENSIPEGMYYIDNKGQNLIKAKEEMSASKWSAYATLPSGAPESISLSGENPSGIKEIQNFENGGRISGIFSINGIKIPSMQKGTNIIHYQNGKSIKVLVE